MARPLAVRDERCESVCEGVESQHESAAVDAAPRGARLGHRAEGAAHLFDEQLLHDGPEREVKLHRFERLLEIPLDSYTARAIRERAEPNELLQWRGVKGLTSDIRAEPPGEALAVTRADRDAAPGTTQIRRSSTPQRCAAKRNAAQSAAWMARRFRLILPREPDDFRSQWPETLSDCGPSTGTIRAHGAE